jgi:hypothetical protein
MALRGRSALPVVPSSARLPSPALPQPPTALQLDQVVLRHQSSISDVNSSSVRAEAATLCDWGAPFAGPAASNSLDDQRTPGLLMEIVNKLVPTWGKRTNFDDAFAAGGNHLLDPECHTLEFHRGGIEILHPQDERPIRRRMDFGRLKMMALDRDRNRIRLLCVDAGAQHRRHKH